MLIAVVVIVVGILLLIAIDKSLEKEGDNPQGYHAEDDAHENGNSPEKGIYP